MLLKMMIYVGLGLMVVCFLITIMVGIPLHRFMTMSDNLIKIYDGNRHYFEEQNKHPCVIVQGKVRIYFVSPKELCEKYEKLANDALKYFEKWGFEAMKDIELLERRERLLFICNEIRKIHNQKQ